MGSRVKHENDGTFEAISHVGLSAHTTTDESGRAGRTPFAGLGGVGPRVKHEDDGGGSREDFRGNDEEGASDLTTAGNGLRWYGRLVRRAHVVAQTQPQAHRSHEDGDSDGQRHDYQAEDAGRFAPARLR